MSQQHIKWKNEKYLSVARAISKEKKPYYAQSKFSLIFFDEKCM